MKPLRIAINGAAGRMGQRLVALASADPNWQLAAALESPGNPKQGQDAGTIAGAGALGVPLSSQLTAEVDVAIDFSTPSGTAAVLQQCLSANVPLVVATTGLDADLIARIDAAAGQIAVLRSPSTSLTVNLAMKFAQMAAQVLKNSPGGLDVEIIEKHHRFKEDAPSGTALKFGSLIAEVLGEDNPRHGREGRTGQRTRSEIGYHAVRIGDNPGEHTILFGLLGETLELTVKASNRDCYAQGALAAARFLAGKPAGSYRMEHVLGLA